MLQINVEAYAPTLAQQFALVQYKAAIENVSREQLAELLLQCMQQLQVRENIVRDLLRQGADL